MILYYCDACGKRTDEKDLEQQSNRRVCRSCAPPKRNKSSRLNISPALPQSNIVKPKPIAVIQKHNQTPPVYIWIGMVTMGVIGLLSGAFFVHRAKGSPEPNVLREKAASTQFSNEANSSTDTLIASNSISNSDIKQNDRTQKTNINDNNDQYDPRVSISNSLLEQARAFYATHPKSPWTFRSKLQSIIQRYQDTAAATEAARIIRDENLPDFPLSKEIGRLPLSQEWEKAPELLDAVDIAQDTVRSGWSKRNAKLVSTGPHAVIMLPYIPADEYDARFIIQRQSGSEAFVVNLPRVDRTCTFMLCGFGGTLHGFEIIKGVRILDQPGHLVKPGLLRTGNLDVLILQVRREQINAYINGQLLCECRQSAQVMEPFEHWTTPNIERLAVGSWASEFELQSVKVLDWTGFGTFVRKPLEQGLPDLTAKLESAKKPFLAVGDSTITATKPHSQEISLRTEEAIYLSKILDLVTKGQWKAAREQIASALNMTKLAPIKADLELDSTLVNLAEKVDQSEEAGATKLSDGRHFTLRKRDGKEVIVGKNAKVHVARVANRTIELDQDFSGGKATFKISLDALTPETRIELSELHLATQPDGYLALTAARCPSAAKTALDDTFTKWIKRAALDSGDDVKIQRLRKWIELGQAEARAREAYEAIAKLTTPDADKALAALNDYKMQFGETALAFSNKAETAALEEKFSGLMRKPGLWATYWSAIDESQRFQSRLFSTIESETYDGLIVERLPNRDIKPECFDLRYEGILRLPKTGTYSFSCEADDRLKIWIDDKLIGDSGIANSFKPADFIAGDHALKIEYSNYRGGGIFRLHCKAPGSDVLARFPSEWLWHRSAQSNK